MRKPLIAPVMFFLAGGWAFVLGTLCRLRVLPFLRPDTILSGGKAVSAAQFAHLASNFFYVAGSVVVVLGVVGVVTLTAAHRRSLAGLPRWQRWMIWPFDGAPRSGRGDQPPSASPRA